MTDELKTKAIKSHQTPNPPLAALRELINCKPSDLPWRAAGIDSSDGLLKAIEGICESSNFAAIIEQNLLPTHDGWPKGIKWDNWCLEGGEDYELLVSLPPLWAKAWAKNFPTARTIGKITKGYPKITWSNGKDVRKNSK